MTLDVKQGSGRDAALHEAGSLSPLSPQWPIPPAPHHRAEPVQTP